MLPFEVVHKVEFWDFVELVIDGEVQPVRIPKYRSPTVGELESEAFYTKRGIVEAALRRHETTPKLSEEDIASLISKLTKLEFEACVEFMQNELSEWNQDQKKQEAAAEESTGLQPTLSSDISTQVNLDSASIDSNTAPSESSAAP